MVFTTDPARPHHPPVFARKIGTDSNDTAGQSADRGRTRSPHQIANRSRGESRRRTAATKRSTLSQISANQTNPTKPGRGRAFVISRKEIFMAITLEANYAKKLGLPNYSSHQYSVTIRTELTDLSQIQAESARLYGMMQDAVDREIQHVGF